MFSLLRIDMQGNQDRRVPQNLCVNMNGLKFSATSYKHKVIPYNYVGFKIQLGGAADPP